MTVPSRPVLFPILEVLCFRNGLLLTEMFSIPAAFASFEYIFFGGSMYPYELEKPDNLVEFLERSVAKYPIIPVRYEKRQRNL